MMTTIQGVKPIPFERKEILFSLENISLTLGQNHILEGITIDVRDVVRPNVHQGQVVGILGLSGTGKSQLCRIMSGLQVPTTGSVTVRSKPLQPGDVGMVAQHYPLLRHRTVQENLMAAAILRGRTTQDAMRQVQEYLKSYGLEDRAEHYPAMLSGGQRQRVSIIQQLLSSDRFIIMDEPFTGLDPVMKDRTIELIQMVSRQDEHNTIFVVAHDNDSLVKISDTLWLLGKDPQNPMGPAGIRRQWDLAQMGLAWKPNVLDTQEGRDLVRDIRGSFG